MWPAWFAPGRGNNGFAEARNSQGVWIGVSRGLVISSGFVGLFDEFAVCEACGSGLDSISWNAMATAAARELASFGDASPKPLPRRKWTRSGGTPSPRGNVGRVLGVVDFSQGGNQRDHPARRESRGRSAHESAAHATRRRGRTSPAGGSDPDQRQQPHLSARAAPSEGTPVDPHRCWPTNVVECLGTL